MTQAYILIEAVPGKALDLVKTLSTLSSVRQVHLVTGPYDAVAFIEAPDLKSLGDILVKDIQSTGLVSRTLTCITVDQ